MGLAYHEELYLDVYFKNSPQIVFLGTFELL